MTDEEKIQLVRALEARRKATPAKELLTGRKSLADYCRHNWAPFMLAKHHALLIEKLEAVARGEIDRLMVFMPPRHGKSLISTQFFPSWYLGLFPDRSIISATYGQDLSDDFGRRVRNTVAGDIHRSIFPECQLAQDSASIRRFNTLAGGSYFGVGRGGPITGRGADLFLIDDPLKDAEEARSEVVRSGLHEWFASVAYTRLAPGGAIVLMQTRWNELDLAGWILSEHPEEKWDVLSLPAIAEHDEPFRKTGEALWPERYPLEVLDKIKPSIGGYFWAALYQQRPQPEEGQIIKRQWIKFYKEIPEDFDEVLQSWDCTFKDTSTSDFVAGHVWARKKADFYLLYRVHERLDCPATMAAVRSTTAKFPRARSILIEDKANGPAVISMLRREISGIIAVEPQGGKESRLRAVSPLYEAGNVYVPDPSLAPWVEDVINEWCSFPNAAHDDDCDAASQALIRLRAGSMAVVNFWKKQIASQHPPDGLTAEQRKTLKETGSVVVTKVGMG